MSILKQNHNAYDDFTVIDAVLQGFPRLVEVQKQKDALYAKEDFTDEDGLLAGELENEFMCFLSLYVSLHTEHVYVV